MLAAVLAAALPVAAPAHARTTQAAAKRAARAVVAQSGVSAADCLGPAGDPAPGSQAWTQRDYVNQYCATERLADELSSPAFATTFWAETPGIFVDQNVRMLLDPTHPHLSLEQFVAGGSTADPYRTLDRWTAAHRGRVTPFSFSATDGAKLNGHLFRPPSRVRGPYPGVVITTGSIQGYQQMYYWAAEGLAEAGYEVMTYDVQGQGDSDTLPASCTPSDCPGVPFQQNYNFFQGTEDALNWFFSGANPGRAQLDARHVGLAGHSLGASAVSAIGQCDPRVDAIVAWDNLAQVAGSCSQQATGLPATAPAQPALTTPALGINSEYFFNPSSQSSPPDPDAKDAAFRELAARGTDTMQIALRSSTHLEYTYVPYILPASRLGERVAYYYTQAWFDRYLRGSKTAQRRLTATAFDASADQHSIGAGGYDPQRAAAKPADTTAGNVPYTIKGLPVKNRLSIYYRSAYSLSGGHVSCSDMRKGC